MLNLRSVFVAGCALLGTLSGSVSVAQAAKAPGCTPPALGAFFYSFGKPVLQPMHQVSKGTVGLLNNSSKPVTVTMLLYQQTLNGFSLSSSVGADVGTVFAKIKTQIDATASRSVTTGATLPMKVTVPPHKRPFIYWAMPTKSVTVHSYVVRTDCTIDRDYGAYTATWLTGSTVLPYVGFQAS